MKRLAVALVFPLVYSGCATPPSGAPLPAPQPAPVSSVAVPPQRNSSESIMAYVLKVKDLGHAGIAEEMQRERDAVNRERSDLHRLKLAVLLIQAGNADDAELLALVDPATQEQVDPNLRALAVLLHTTLTERRKARDSLQAAQGRLREAQKVQENTQLRNDQLKKQLEDLEKKLSALKSIEQSLIQRK